MKSSDSYIWFANKTYLYRVIHFGICAPICFLFLKIIITKVYTLRYKSYLMDVTLTFLGDARQQDKRQLF